MKTIKRLALGLATLVGCACAQAAGSLVVGSAGDLRSFYPAGSTENANLTIQQQVYEGLLAWTEKGDVAPMLATSLPTVSADNLTYTFTLRDKIKFHDGTPLTAQAAAKSWNFLLDAKTGWPCRQYFNGSGAIHITDVVATGPLQLQVKLEKPAAGLLTQMARADCASGGIMAEAVYTEPKASKPIGTGPFMIQSIQPGQKIVLTPFKDYQSRSEPADGYAGKKQAMVDTLTFQIIPDPAANNSALLAGAIDIWYGINPAYAKDLASKKGVKLSSVPVPSINTVLFETAKPPFDKPALRQAISTALDRAGMVAAISQGYGQASASIVPSSSPYYDGALKKGFEYDPTKVAALLKEAGYKGEKLVLTTNKNYTIMYDTGVMIQALLQASGLNVDIEVIDFATQMQKYMKADFQMMTWNYSPTLDSALLLDRIAGDKAADITKIWNNPQARTTIDQILRAPAAERQPLYDKVHALYLQDPPLVVWSSADSTDASRDRVKGYSAWKGRMPRLWNVSVDPN